MAQYNKVPWTAMMCLILFIVFCCFGHVKMATSECGIKRPPVDMPLGLSIPKVDFGGIPEAMW